MIFDRRLLCRLTDEEKEFFVLRPLFFSLFAGRGEKGVRTVQSAAEYHLKESELSLYRTKYDEREELDPVRVCN